MEKIHETIHINAPREKVWDVMLSDATYRDWTSVFNPGGSSFEGDWSEGSTMKFIGPDPETGKSGGMLSRVKENRKPEFISIEHYGIIKDGVEDTTSDEVKKWTPAFENYTLNEKDGGTEVVVDIDTEKDYVSIFEGMWPKALARLKELAEK
jgi:uncharacterized protein YndB with AHSA1/START domain